MNKKPTYSICMCNYNMEDTLDRSLRSLLGQLDARFEIVIADDGSNDDSVEVIKNLQKEFTNIRLIELPRDPNRKLGFTRNISIQEAQGEYVMLHLDCDDVFGPHINDFVIVFHQIEKCLGRDVLVSGKHVNMARRSFLLDHGPYRNLFRAEDRDLWRRLAAIDAYIPLEHDSFVMRLPKTNSNRRHRVIKHTWDQMIYDYRIGIGLCEFMQHEKGRKHKSSFVLRVLRGVLLLPAYMASKFYEPLTYPQKTNTIEKMQMYKEQMSGTVCEILQRNNCKADLSGISEDGQKFFKIES